MEDTTAVVAEPVHRGIPAEMPGVVLEEHLLAVVEHEDEEVEPPSAADDMKDRVMGALHDANFGPREAVIAR